MLTRNSKARLAALVLASVALAACGGDDGASPDVATGGSPGESAETYSFTVNGISPADNPNSVIFEQYLDSLEEASDGRLDFDWHPGGELVPTSEALDALGQGTIDMLLSQASSYTDEVPLGGWSDIPVYPDGYRDSLESFYDTEIQEILDQAYREKTNTTVLQARVFNPYVFIMAPGKEIRTVEDFQGKKIRSAGGPQGQILEALGATPVTLTPGDFYTSFQQGIVDGFILPLYALSSYKLEELAGSVTTPGIGVTATQLVWMNLDRWNELPSELQDLIRQTSEEEIDDQVEYWEAQDQEAIEFAEASGLEIIEMSEEEQERLREATAGPVIEAFISQTGEEGQKVVDELTS